MYIRISKKHTGQKFTDERKRNISKSKLGVQSPLLGSQFSKQDGKRKFLTPNCCRFIDKVGNVIKFKNELINLYNNLKYSIPDIVKYYNISKKIVYKSLLNYNIKLRSNSERVYLSNKKRIRGTPFTG